MIPNYGKIAREAVPIRADCYDCNKTWSGPTSRSEALAHLETERHAIWVECRPKEDAG